MGRLALLSALFVAACTSGPALPRTETGGLWQDASIFVAVGQTMAAAHSRVLVEMYEFGRADLALGLVEARARGADVRVVLDPTVPVTLVTGRRLAAAGVPVRYYPVDDHALQIDHVKLLLGDDRAVVGGMNWGANSDRNHDYALLLRAPPELRRLSRIFEQDWALAGGAPAPLPPEQGPITQTAPGNEVRRLLEATLGSARTRIEAEVFDLADADVVLLLQSAHRRGVWVRVLLDPGQDVNRPSFALLRRASTEVRWFVPPAGAKLHAKAVLADGVLVLGSANWSHHGLDVNHELDVTTVDPGAIAAYAARFETDWRSARE
ncbi:MAG: phosphatidylserine/phosphatidylglycerophosphate/cardiolipin synthase family protein [Candidatus Dormibacteraeota bacterium]|nr:phosphatidylserine/phosphatidylglycerophosphate/cardiolipin synthase family protein [Candidatus Dormibacteraeota bacterium]